MSGTPDQTPGRHAPPHRRVRRSMYLAFIALAALAVAQALLAHHFERTRADDAAMLKLAGGQRAASQQLARIGATVASGQPAAAAAGGALRAMLAKARQETQSLEAELHDTLADVTTRPQGLRTAIAGWRDARERLWQRGDALQRLLDTDDRAPEPLAIAAAALQAEADPSLAAATALADALNAASRERSHRQVHLLEVGVGLTVLLLTAIALLVVEPTARSVQDHVRRLGAQAEELWWLAKVAEHTANEVVITDASRRVQWVNAAFTRNTGYTLDEVRGCHPRMLHSPDNDPAALRQLRAASETGQPLRLELLSRAKDGREYWLEADIQPLRDGTGPVRGTITVATNVDERRRLQEQLRQSVRTDALTGLPNRAVVLDRVQRALDHAARNPGYGFAVLFMDFDRFKQVNDTLGHAAGDELLRQVGRRIEDTLRPGDAVARVPSALQTAARIGGDEFVVVLEGIHSADEARTIGERLLQQLALPYQLGGHAVQSGASIGIVTADPASGNVGSSADDVLRDADTAMYEAKRAGRGRCVVFDAAMHDRVVQALQTENDLRRALRDGELFVVYQPLMDLASGNAIGVEALVRWRHPTRGLVSPVEFIGIAEEAGLIDAIGQQVLQAACRQFALWRRELGADAPRELAVNLSRAQLKLPGLAAEVRAVLEQNCMQPHELQFEVTESLAAQDERVQAALRELKALGVRLALDDFGTGYSSLACLHQLPVDTVKIDRSFVAHAETVEYHRVLIEATISVAQTLGMTTVAEGIETAGQAALMRRLRCDRGQGYLFAKPLAADELARWVTARARGRELAPALTDVAG